MFASSYHELGVGDSPLVDLGQRPRAEDGPHPVLRQKGEDGLADAGAIQGEAIAGNRAHAQAPVGLGAVQINGAGPREAGQVGALAGLAGEPLQEGPDALDDDGAHGHVRAELEEGEAEGPARARALGDAAGFEDCEIAEGRGLVHAGFPGEAGQADGAGVRAR